MISNIKVHSYYSFDCWGSLTRRNLVYDLTKPDGSIFRVQRTWRIYDPVLIVNPSKRGTWELVSAPEFIVPLLTQYIEECEKIVGTKPVFINQDLGGAIHYSTLIQAAPHPTTPLPSNISQLVSHRLSWAK